MLVAAADSEWCMTCCVCRNFDKQHLQSLSYLATNFVHTPLWTSYQPWMWRGVRLCLPVCDSLPVCLCVVLYPGSDIWKPWPTKLYFFVCRHAFGISRSYSYVNVSRSSDQDQGQTCLCNVRGWSDFYWNAVLFSVMSSEEPCEEQRRLHAVNTQGRTKALTWK